MDPAPSIEDFLARPRGRYFLGGTYLVWNFSPNFSGSAMWGEPNAQQICEILRLWDFGRELPTPEGGIDVITDGSRLSRFDPEGFRLVLDYANQRAAEFATRYRRHAIVHPTGMTAAVMAGIFSLVGTTHQSRLFEDPQAAFTWFDRPEAARADRDVRALVEKAMGLSPVVRQLRHELAGDLVHASVDRFAKRLGRSVRGLQRELEQNGTSFRAELEDARIAAARRLLVETDLKLELIAPRVGCSTLPVFSRMFRRIVGISPSHFRRHQR